MGRPKGSKNKRNIDYLENNMSENQELPSGVTLHNDTFSITVSNDADADAPHYKNDKEPFSYRQVADLPAALRQFDGDIDDTTAEFLNEAIKSEANAKAVAEIVSIVNGKLKANAKNSRYQSVMNQYKPMSADDAAKAFERMVSTFAQLNKVSLDVARATLAALKPVE